MFSAPPFTPDAAGPPSPSPLCPGPRRAAFRSPFRDLDSRARVPSSFVSPFLADIRRAAAGTSAISEARLSLVSHLDNFRLGASHLVDLPDLMSDFNYPLSARFQREESIIGRPRLPLATGDA